MYRYTFLLYVYTEACVVSAAGLTRELASVASRLRYYYTGYTYT